MCRLARLPCRGLRPKRPASGGLALAGGRCPSLLRRAARSAPPWPQRDARAGDGGAGRAHSDGDRVRAQIRGALQDQMGHRVGTRGPAAPSASGLGPGASRRPHRASGTPRPQAPLDATSTSPGPPLDARAPDSAWTHRSGAGSLPAVDHREATKSPLSPGPHASPTSPRGQAPCGHLEPVLVAEGAGRGSPPGLGPFLRPQWASNESTGVVGSLPLPTPIPLSLQLRLEIREGHPFPGCRPPTPRGLKSSRSWCPGLRLESQLPSPRPGHLS